MQQNAKYKDIPLLISFVLTIFVNLPQLWKTWKTKDVSSFSIYTIVLRLLIQISFGIYGFMEADIIIIIMSIEVFLCESLLLLFKQMYTRKIVTARVIEVGPHVPMENRLGTIRKGKTWNNISVLFASV